ncbi:MAG: response regulator transcription factor [Alphaproteobacteria bacterium]|nr:response regulator transcription factor [Alphaproteobacteria bacterium]
MDKAAKPPGRERVLVVEDEAVTRDLLTTLLAAEFEVSMAANAAEARERLSRNQPLIVLLDLNLPDGDGLALAREVGARSGIGMIMVTARTDEIDRIVGLEVGADDYITKPFNPRELLARVKALVRRMRGAAGGKPAGAGAGSVLRFEGWTLDMGGRSLHNAQGQEVYLTRAEFDLLATLAGRIGRVQTRDQLLDAVAGRGPDPLDRTIDVLVGRVRRKIENDPKVPKLIVTVPGYGYKFASSSAN